MKKIVFVCMLLLSQVGYSQNTESEKVIQLHKKKFLWITSKNYDSIKWVTDANLKFIHSNGWIQTQTELIDDLKSGKLNYTSITVTEASVNFFGKSTAVVTGKGMFKGLMPDKSEFNVNLLYTEVYVKLKKDWKLVGRQATKLVN
jgi:hypothetical protein